MKSYNTAKDLYRKGRRVFAHHYNYLTDFNAKFIILVYHRILPRIQFNPLNNTVSLEAFSVQIEELAGRYPIIGLSDALDQCRSGKAKAKIQAVLTFDDGYSDNYDIVFPILRQKGLPAAFFLVTDYIGNAGPLWDLELLDILADNEEIKSVQIEGRDIYQTAEDNRQSYAFRVFERMKALNSCARKKVMDSLSEKAKNRPAAPCRRDGFITWEQVKRMSREGMEIGSHGLSHCSLAKIPFQEAAAEISRSKEIIENTIDKKCMHFSFPFGSRNDYNQALIDYARKIGFRSCLLNVHGYNRVREDIFHFKRVIMEESSNLRYLLG